MRAGFGATTWNGQRSYIAVVVVDVLALSSLLFAERLPFLFRFAFVGLCVTSQNHGDTSLRSRWSPRDDVKTQPFLSLSKVVTLLEMCTPARVNSPPPRCFAECRLFFPSAGSAELINEGRLLINEAVEAAIYSSLKRVALVESVVVAITHVSIRNFFSRQRRDLKRARG